MRYKDKKKLQKFHFIFFVFFLILIYLAVQIYFFASKEKIGIFVVEPSVTIEQAHAYRGVITREEMIFYTPEAGYVNYYETEGKKAAAGTTIYTLDETGEFSRILAGNYTDGSYLSEEMLGHIKYQLAQASLIGTNGDYSEISKDKEAMAAAVLDAFLATAMKELNNNHSEWETLNSVKTTQSGYILFQTDQMEDLTPEEVTADTFLEGQRKVTVYASGDQRNAGEFAYKLIRDDCFSVTFPITEEDAVLYRDEKYLTITLPSLNVSVTGAFSVFTSSDGIMLGRVDLTKYGSEYLKDRFITFEIADNEVSGYKIPVGSVTQKEFYLVPSDFIVKDPDTQIRSIYKENLNADNKMYEEVTFSIYSEGESYFYIDSKSLQPGDYLVLTNTMGKEKEEKEEMEEEVIDRFMIGLMGSLDGVYNVNKGYCVFRQIDIITATEDQNYYMIRTGTRYGISTYDRILLNAESAEENQMVQ